MVKECSLRTDVYTVTFRIFSIRIQNDPLENSDYHNADYVVEFALHPVLGEVVLQSGRVEYYVMDLSAFAESLEEYCNKIIEQGRTDFGEPNVGHEHDVFLPYSKRFHVEFGYGGAEGKNADEFYFSMRFMVNLAQHLPDSPAFVGGDGKINVKEALHFVASLREILSEPF
jgi:hypothetical protein